MTMFSTPRNVASPKASRALPVSVPGPQIVLEFVLLEPVENDAHDKVFSWRDVFAADIV